MTKGVKGFQKGNTYGRRFKKGHTLTPKSNKHPNYKSGREITKDGYIRIIVEGYHPRKHKGKVFEHVLAKEKELGRFLYVPSRKFDCHNSGTEIVSFYHNLFVYKLC